MAVPAVGPSYTWVITKPDSTTDSGSGASADVVTDQAGVYSCTFTATADRDCPPADRDVGPATKQLAFAADLTLDPSSIPAFAGWGGPNYRYSRITVEWDPPECEGRVEIAEVEPTGDYVPPNDGWVTKDGDHWVYEAFAEPQGALCPEPVRVWVAAFQGDTEVARRSILVLPVHTFWTNGHQHGPGAQQHPPDNDDFWNDYDFLRWKYAAVHATTGGTFAAVRISNNPCVDCRTGLFTWVCVPACTHDDGSVDFGTGAFAGSENSAASMIGHELTHTIGATECQAYTWEFNNDAATGIFPCDADYLADVVQKLNCECSGIGCPE